MTLTPRYYQQEAFDAVIAQECRALVKLPTGTGKTLIFPMLARAERFKDSTTVILAEHEELLDQAKEKFLLCNPDTDIGIVGFGKAEWDHDVILGGVDTLSYQKRLDVLKSRNVGLIITDECHHAVNESYAKIYASCEDAFLFGTSATINRHDQRDITAIFGPPVYSKTINEMIDEEYLCGIVPYVIKTTNVIDSSVLAKGASDYSEAKLEQAVNRKDRNECIVSACHEEKYGGPDVPTVVFCAGTQHAKAQADAFNRGVIAAAAITQDTPAELRKQYYRDFATGALKVLTNVQILTEGWDADVRRIVFARPTKSQPLYVQMLGRGTRTAPGKKYCILLDLTDNFTDHATEPCTIEDALGIEIKEGMNCREAIRKAKENNGGATPDDGEGKKKREKEIAEHNALVEKQLSFRYDWTPVAGGAYISSVKSKKGGGELILYPSKNGGYIVGMSYKDSPFAASQKDVVLARNVSLSWAQSIAEQHAKNLQLGNFALVDPSAPWRKNPPSDAQLKALNKIRRATRGQFTFPKDITRGEASDLLSKGWVMMKSK